MTHLSLAGQDHVVVSTFLVIPRNTNKRRSITLVYTYRAMMMTVSRVHCSALFHHHSALCVLHDPNSYFFFFSHKNTYHSMILEKVE